LKISDKKSLSNHALKITAHENYVALSIIFYQSLIKRIVMLNKINRANGIYGGTPCSSGFCTFMLFQVNVVAQKKQMEKSTTINTTSDETNRLKPEGK
jgi:hypothetical protein